MCVTPRYQYDPHGGIQQSMKSIWSSVVPDSKKAVSTCFTLMCSVIGSRWSHVLMRTHTYVRTHAGTLAHIRIQHLHSSTAVVLCLQVAQYQKEIMSDLMQNLNHNLWRNRESRCMRPTLLSTPLGICTVCKT